MAAFGFPSPPQRRSRSGQPAPRNASFDFASPRYLRRQASQTRDKRQQNKERAAALEATLRALGIGPSPTSGGGYAPAPPPQVPMAPVMGNRYAGAERAVTTQSAESRRYLASQLRGKGPAATGSAGRTMGSFQEQVAQQLAAYSSGARNVQAELRGKHAEDELRRSSELSKARFERELEQEKVNQQSQLSLSMIQSLAAHGLDPTAFMGDPVGAAITLGRLQYARGGAGAPTTSQVAQLAELGLNYLDYPTSTDAALAIGEARRGQYGGMNIAEEFLRWLQGR